jgi:hypothetical protein
VLTVGDKGPYYHHFFENMDSKAGSISDHDLTVIGLKFDYPGGPDRGGGHSIEFSKARHVLVSGVQQVGGGNVTAMIGDDDVTETNILGYGLFNSCLDHWGGTTNWTVSELTCYLRPGVAGSFGVQDTGLATDNKTNTPGGAGLLTNIRVYAPGNKGACLNFNGGSAGGTISKILVNNFFCDVTGSSAVGVIHAYGSMMIIENFIIEGASSVSITQTSREVNDDIIANGYLIGCSFTAPHQANIELNGTHNVVHDVRLVRGCGGTPVFTSDASSIVENVVLDK